MDGVDREGHVGEGVLEGLGDAGDEGGQGHRDHEGAGRLALGGLGGVPDGQCGGGQREHHDREEAGREAPGPGVRAVHALEEAGDVTVRRIPGGRLAGAELEPGHGVEQVVQTEGDEQAVDGTEDEDRQGSGDALGVPGVDEPAAELFVDEPVEGRVERRHHQGDDKSGTGGDDGDEAASAEEGQPVGQLDAVVALPEQGSDDADDDAAQHPVVDGRLSGDVTELDSLVPGADLCDLPRGGIEGVEAVEGLLAQGRGLAHDDGRHGPGDGPVDEEAEQRGHPGGAVGLLGESYGDANGEDEGQVVEDRPTGRTEDVCDGLQPGRLRGEPLRPQHVRLPQTQQQTRCRERGDGQHQGSPQTLGKGEGTARLLLD